MSPNSIRRIKICTGVLAIMSATAVRAAEIDGTLSENCTKATSSWTGMASSFDNNVLPKNGGRAYFNATFSTTVNFAADATLGGMDFCANKDCKPTFTATEGKKLVLTGDAFLTRHVNQSQPNMAAYSDLVENGPLFNVPISAGEASDTVTKRGGGAILLGRAMSGFAKVVAEDGTLVGRMTSGDFLTDSKLEMTGGKVEFRPAAVAGDNPAVSLSQLDVVSGMNYLKITKGSADSASIAISTISVDRDAILVLVPSAGASALGTTEKVFVSDGLPAENDGCLDGRFVVLDKTTAHYSLKWARYDSEKGFVAVDPVFTGEETANCGYALNVAAGQSVGAVILRASSGHTALNCGNFDAGARPGVVYLTTLDGNRWPSFKSGTKFSSTVGMTFAGVLDNHDNSSVDKPIFNLDGGQVGWSGYMRSHEVRIYFSAGAYPSTITDFYFDGGEGLWASGMWQTGGNNAFKASQRLHLATVGSPLDGAGALLNNNAAAWTLPTTRVDRASLFLINGDQSVSSMAFPCLVDGPGDLKIRCDNTAVNGNFTFSAANETSGKVVIGGSRSYVSLKDAGTFGTSPVELNGGTLELTSSILRRDVPARVLPNDITQSAGTVAVRGVNEWEATKVAFAGATRLTSVDLRDSGEIGIGTDVSMTSVSRIRGMPFKFYPIERNSRLTLDLATAQDLDVEFADGAEDTALELVKTGAGTLTLDNPRSRLEKIDIREGTVKVTCPDLLNSADVAWWLDASDASTITKDANGCVTDMASKNGNGITFVYRPDFFWDLKKGPTVTAGGLNGLDVLSFSHKTNVNTGVSLFCSDKRTTQRTICCVIVPKKELNENYYAGLFGRGTGGGEWGLRFHPNNCQIEAGNTAGDTYHWNDSGVRINGVQKSEEWASFDNNKAMVLSAKHHVDVYNNSDRWASGRCSFQIGGYTGRYFNGDIAEMIAFNRELTDDEIKSVENYLYKKWIDSTATLNGNVELPVAASSFANEPDVTVDAGGTLDLCGHDLAVGNLSGVGKVVNSGAPAVLRITGTSDFKGSVGAGVTLATAGGAATFVPAVVRPNEDGLLYWLDASLSETVLTDASSHVTGWVSRASTPISGLYSQVKTYNQLGGPVNGYSTTAFRGKLPAVVYANGPLQTLVADKAAATKTLFVVWEYQSWTSDAPSGYVAYEHFFGNYGQDNALRAYDSYAFKMQTSNFLVRDDLIRINGSRFLVTRNADPLMLKHAGTGMVFTMRLNPGHLGEDVVDTTSRSYGWYAQYKDALGSAAKGAFGMNVSEVIAYDRRLSDAEIAEVEAYLNAKWINQDAISVPTQVFTEPKVLVVENADMVMPIVLNGDQDLSKIKLDASSIALKKGDAPVKVLEVTGTASGEFAGVSVARRCEIQKKPDGYYVVRPDRGLLLVVQ